MAMTAIEYAAKNQIINKILKAQGYPTYAALFGLFDLNLTDDPDVVGYMEPGKARIVLNRGLGTDQVSVIVRHEILHEYLSHGPRGDAFERKKYKDMFGKDDGRIGNHDLSNMAADWEISNRGYTAADKTTVKNLTLGDRVLKGLVTELDRPGWENLTFEEMYDKLIDENKDNIKDAEEFLKQNYGNGKPQIGSKGNQQIQDAEEVERQANAISDDAGEMIDKAKREEKEAQKGKDSEAEEQAKKDAENAKDNKEKADQLADAANKLKDAAEDASNSQSKDDVFKDESTIEKQRKIQERIEKLKKALSDLDTFKRIEKDTDVIRDKENIAKAAKDADRYKAKPINNFKASLNDFIAKELMYNRGGTWRKFNKNAISQGIVKRGISSYSNGYVPVINVYFDRSGSFSSRPDKTRDAESAIAALNQYVVQGKLKINLYYASDDVYQSRDEAECHGGGMDSDPVIQHIKATKPDNVIILTDNDADYGLDSAEVPGAVWYLFYGDDAPNFVKRLRGDKLTKTFVL